MRTKSSTTASRRVPHEAQRWRYVKQTPKETLRLRDVLCSQMMKKLVGQIEVRAANKRWEGVLTNFGVICRQGEVEMTCDEGERRENGLRDQGIADMIWHPCFNES